MVDLKVFQANIASVSPIFRQLQRFTCLHLGSFLFLASPLSASTWVFSGEGMEAFTSPQEVEVIAEAPPEAFSASDTTVVALVEPPGSVAAPSSSALLLGLRDGGHPTLGAAIAKGGFEALQASVSFGFYTTTPLRNGVLLVRLLNRESQVLASFQLLGKEQPNGEIALNPLSPTDLRRTPGDHDLYSGGVWTPVNLDYDGARLQWKLRIGTHEYSELPVDASLVDTAMERVEIHTGYGSSTKTVLYLDQITVKSTQR